MVVNAANITERELEKAREEGMILERIGNLSTSFKDMRQDVNAQIAGIKDILSPVQVLAQQAHDKAEANTMSVVKMEKDLKSLQTLPTELRVVQQELVAVRRQVAIQDERQDSADVWRNRIIGGGIVFMCLFNLAWGVALLYLGGIL